MIWKSLQGGSGLVSTYSHGLQDLGVGRLAAGRHTSKGTRIWTIEVFYLINSHSEQVNCSEHFVYAESLWQIPKGHFLPLSLFTMIGICSSEYLDPGISFRILVFACEVVLYIYLWTLDRISTWDYTSFFPLLLFYHSGSPPYPHSSYTVLPKLQCVLSGTLAQSPLLSWLSLQRTTILENARLCRFQHLFCRILV